jgi:hypothetical protein
MALPGGVAGVAPCAGGGVAGNGATEPGSAVLAVCAASGRLRGSGGFAGVTVADFAAGRGASMTGGG